MWNHKMNPTIIHHFHQFHYISLAIKNTFALYFESISFCRTSLETSKACCLMFPKKSIDFWCGFTPVDNPSFPIVKKWVKSSWTGKIPSTGSSSCDGFLHWIELNGFQSDCHVMKGRSLPIFSEVCEYFGHVFNCLEANLRVLIGFVLKNVIIKLLCDGTP